MTGYHLAQLNLGLPVEPAADDRLLVNMSVWESLEALADYVYRDPAHLAVLRRRREWFVPAREPMTVLWWVPAGHRPTVAEAEERVRHLRAHGPTPYAFTFRSPFPAPDADISVSADEDWRCPAC